MEAILTSSQADTDVLPPNLKYGLDPSGSFVVARREATTYTLGSSYSPAGVKMLQYTFGSSAEWLVPEILFSADFQNLDAVHAAWPATPDANCLFERIDIRCGGTLIESVTESARCNSLFTQLTMSPQKKINLAQLGFGTAIPTAEPDWSAAANHEAMTIPASGTKRIHWRCNLSGLLSQHRWLPLFALGEGTGLTVSFYLAPVDESLIKNFGGTTYSQSYILKECKAFSSMITLDSELQENYNAALISGNSLKIPIKSIESMWSYLANSTVSGKCDIPMSRSYTRLSALFATFVQEPPASGDGKVKLCNSFYVHAGSAETLSYSLQMGTRRVPDNDSVGFGEAWYRLLNCVGIQGSLAHSTGITYSDYSTSSFCIGISTEKIPHLASTGENLSNTSTIFLRMKGWGTTAADLPSRCHLISEFDNVVEIRDTTVELFT